MKLGRVTGTVVSTVKYEKYRGMKLLKVRHLDLNLAEVGEELVALDAALKAAAVSIVSLTMPPSETNFMGVILTGDQAACAAAAHAFQTKVLEVARQPFVFG